MKRTEIFESSISNCGMQISHTQTMKMEKKKKNYRQRRVKENSNLVVCVCWFYILKCMNSVQKKKKLDTYSMRRRFQVTNNNKKKNHQEMIEIR